MNRFVPHSERHGSVVHGGDGSQWLRDFIQEQDMPQYDHRAYARRQSLPRTPRNNDHTRFAKRRLWVRPAATFGAAVALFVVGVFVVAAL